MVLSSHAVEDSILRQAVLLPCSNKIGSHKLKINFSNNLWKCSHPNFSPVLLRVLMALCQIRDQNPTYTSS